jgi:hypothetical protein
MKEVDPRILCNLRKHLQTRTSQSSGRTSLTAALLDDARAVAARDGATLRELVEAGLRREVKERKSRTRFPLRDASVGGNGLQVGVRDANGEKLRKLAYEGRGA